MGDNARICENPGCNCRMNSVKLASGADTCILSGNLKYCVSCAKAFDMGVAWASLVVNKDVGAAQDKIVAAQDGLTEAVVELDAIKTSNS